MTVADAGATVVARPGRPITLTLAPTNVGNWVRPTTSNAEVLRLDSVTGGYPSKQTLQARFSVVGRGRSGIMTTTDPACSHGHPACAPPQQQWQVRVIVR
ncbi:hypothetical protein Airi02_102180 [Actinoallomurus iriomotensis]|uniref:Uncharacterized protein n=1 Tax=Actinoallomurus iriomotensis TaxID=478107 RepID=A0A9W6SG69_9ACTN|nr:hypothetical protein Airi02_102180 [Actinoallomurus iriomotensis]